MDIEELPLPEPEPLWPYRVWSALHAVSALAFLVFIYFTGPTWPGTLMAFVVGVNLTMARYYSIFGNLIERGNRNVAALEELKRNYIHLAETIGLDPDATLPKDQQ